LGSLFLKDLLLWRGDFLKEEEGPPGATILFEGPLNLLKKGVFLKTLSFKKSWGKLFLKEKVGF